ncbi:MAG TPA: signal recognition particle-docking protein FtsY, partial [Firmicutes bacterium]|nr:signal recognition particle-docking protein FtsY [Bacillota bacterium]
MGLFNRLKAGLQKTRSNLLGRLGELFSRSQFDDDFYDELEEILIGADVGVETTLEVVEKLRTQVKAAKVTEAAQVMEILKKQLLELLGNERKPIELAAEKPTVILVLGVNGVGKTTTIGKLASLFQAQGKKVMLAAGDTFRAAAIEQLEIWASRSKSELVKHQQGADPSAVLFDGVNAAMARGCDILLCDTAGRLHNKTNLMEELKKVLRVIGK